MCIRDRIKEALDKFGKIELCSGRRIEESFTRMKDSLVFWFNDSTNSTRVITRKIQ